MERATDKHDNSDSQDRTSTCSDGQILECAVIEDLHGSSSNNQPPLQAGAMPLDLEIA